MKTSFCCSHCGASLSDAMYTAPDSDCALGTIYCPNCTDFDKCTHYFEYVCPNCSVQSTFVENGSSDDGDVSTFICSNCSHVIDVVCYDCDVCETDNSAFDISDSVEVCTRCELNRFTHALKYCL